MENEKIGRKEATLERILKHFRSYYNIYELSQPEEEIPEELPVRYRCEYFEENSQYIFTKKAEIWSAKGEEFLYLITTDHMTKALFEQCRDFIYEDGMKRIHVGPGHMYSYITMVILCDTCDEEAEKALKKCRIYKSFRFSLHGWMDFRVVLQKGDSDRFLCNGSGSQPAKILKKVLYQKTKKER